MKKCYETNADIYVFSKDKINTDQPQGTKPSYIPVLYAIKRHTTKI